MIAGPHVHARGGVPLHRRVRPRRGSIVHDGGGFIEGFACDGTTQALTADISVHGSSIAAHGHGDILVGAERSSAVMD